MSRKRRDVGALLATLAMIGVCFGAMAPATDLRHAEPDDATGTHDEDWPSYGRDPSEQRFSPLAQIRIDNVAQLGVAWYYEMKEARGVESTPLVIDGVLYATSAWSVVYALNARTGQELWTFDPHVKRAVGAKSCCDVVNRGVAYANDTVFLAALDGRLIALNARTGRPIWTTQTIDDTTQNYVITGAPRIAKNLVIIGNSGGDLGARGYIGAYDLRTGQRVWRFYTVPGDPAKGPDHAASDNMLNIMARTWNGRWWQQGGGGSVWDSITYDPELDRVYFGVDNGAPWNQQLRSPGGGDNLFLASIVALDRASGKYVWHYQVTPGETWDTGATQSLVLATVSIDGKPRRVLMQAPKNGFFYVIDRDSGKLISAKAIVPMLKSSETPAGQPIAWAYGIDMASGRPLENPEARFPRGSVVTVHPTGPGAHGWEPMAFSPTTGLMYIPTQDFSSTFQTDPTYVPAPYLRASGLKGGAAIPKNAAIRAAIPKRMNARLIAWNPIAQTEAWHVSYGYAGNGGVLATAGDLVFQGASDGTFTAYDATRGTELWSFDAQATAQGGPISYATGGQQYIAIAIGNGGSSFLAGGLGVPPKKGTPTGRIVAFKLQAHVTYPTVDTALDAVPMPPPAQGSKEDIDRGASEYGAYCAGCHGFGAISGFVTPDLRRSAYLQNAAAFRSVVKDGILLGQGMPNFGNSISTDAAEDIRAFLIDEAHYIYDQEHAAAPASPPSSQ